MQKQVNLSPSLQCDDPIDHAVKSRVVRFSVDFRLLSAAVRLFSGCFCGYLRLFAADCGSVLGEGARSIQPDRGAASAGGPSSEAAEGWEGGGAGGGGRGGGAGGGGGAAGGGGQRLASAAAVNATGASSRRRRVKLLEDAPGRSKRA